MTDAIDDIEVQHKAEFYEKLDAAVAAAHANAATDRSRGVLVTRDFDATRGALARHPIQSYPGK